MPFDSIPRKSSVHRIACRCKFIAFHYLQANAGYQALLCPVRYFGRSNSCPYLDSSRTILRRISEQSSDETQKHKAPLPYVKPLN